MRILFFTLLFAGCFAFAGLADTRDLRQDPKKKVKAPKYSAIMITQHDGTILFDTVEDSTVKELKKDLDRGYKDAVKQYDAAKKAAKKNKESFTTPRPVKPKLKVLAKGVSKEKANAAKEKAEQAHKKKTESAQPKRKK